MSILSERLIAVHEALDTAGLPHAFGGAIALAYCTQEPRGTRDIDVNVFVGAERADEVLEALPTGVSIGPRDRTAARRDAQVRVMWDETPIDVFFDADEFHGDVARTIIEVPFEDTTIPVLGCDSLIVFKAMFNRTRDWADIEAIVEAGAAGGAAVDYLKKILGASDPIVTRLKDLLML